MTLIQRGGAIGKTGIKERNIMTDIKTERILENPALAIDHAGEGELLIMMHGIGGNRTNWTEQIKALSEMHTIGLDACADMLEMVDVFRAISEGEKVQVVKAAEDS